MSLPKKTDGWGAIADYIITKENDSTWSTTGEASQSLSFTRWGLEQAKEIGVSKFTFWQYRRAGLLYNMLLGSLPQEKQIPLRDLKDVTPEHLNELQKLSRVAPAELFRDLCERVIVKRDITRKELRALWASLKPAMGGETARGRGKHKSFELRIKENNEHAKNCLLEGLLLVAVKDNLPLIFGRDNRPQLFDCREQYRPDSAAIIDALVLCNAETDRHGFGYKTHGLCIVHFHPDKDLSLLSSDTPSFPCDKLWLVVPHTGNKTPTYDDYPDYLGIIAAEVDEAMTVATPQVIRKPHSVTNAYEYTISLLAAELCKTKP